jgi:type IV pilus assembly protein PilA
VRRYFRRKLSEKRTAIMSGNQSGMSVTELMVAICIIGILAAVAIPFYINYVQQARVVSIIIPRLHIIESNISLFFSMENRLPGAADISHVLENVDTDQCDISIASGTIKMVINASDTASNLHILNGKVLIASPVISRFKIVSWHLSGELADRLRINY